MNNDEQRQEYRLPRRLTVFIELGDGDSENPILVASQSLDISANGLRVITDQELPEGSILRSCVHTDEKRFVLVTDVKWCNAWHNPGEYLVGLALFESEDTDIQEWKEFIAAQCESEE
jgi:hypothetical protein